MDRREFLGKGTSTAAGLIAGSAVFSLLFGTTSCEAAPKIIGLQLYSLREAMEEDVSGTLQKVADMGYKRLETAGYKDGKIYGYEPSEFRKMVENLGMSVTSAHCGRSWDPEKEEEIMEWWDTALDTHKASGCRYVIQPSFPIGDELEDIKVYIDYFNKVADLAAKKGLKFGFHNHSREFEKRGGQVIMDYMIQNSNDNMFFELDVYWATKGGVDPVDYINKYGKKITLFHIKDESIIGESGTIDFEPIFNAAYKNGITDYYVEVEKYTLPAENCVEKSFDFLDVALYVK